MPHEKPQNHCEAKVPYTTREDAVKQMIRMVTHGGRRKSDYARIYRCDICHKYHITTQK